MDDVNRYIVKWRDGDGGEARTLQTSFNVRGLTPNTTYNVTVAARNRCGVGTISSAYFVITDVSIETPMSLSTAQTSMMLLPKL